MTLEKFSFGVGDRFAHQAAAPLRAFELIAAQIGERYLDALDENREVVARNVTGNIYDRHLKPLFLDQ